MLKSVHLLISALARARVCVCVCVCISAADYRTGFNENRLKENCILHITCSFPLPQPFKSETSHQNKTLKDKKVNVCSVNELFQPGIHSENSKSLSGLPSAHPYRLS